MRYTKSALGLLNAQYRSVLKKCLLINLGLFALAAISATPAMAENGDITIAPGGTVSGTNGSTDPITVNIVNDFATAAQGALADSAVQSVATGTANGTISVDGSDVAVKGLGSAAYTDSTAYATAAQGALADSALQSADITTGTANGTISVDGADVAVKGLGSAAYTDSTAYATSAQGALADSAVQSVATGTTNGTISVDGSDVAVKGLGSAAYTDSTAYATAAQGALADSAVQSVATGTANGTISVDGSDVAVKGLGSAAYTDSTAYATAEQGAKADAAANQDLSNLSAAGTAVITDAVKTGAENADFTAGSSTALSGQNKIGDAINTLGGAVDTINTAITVTTDGNYIRAANDVKANLGALDTQAKANADEIAKRTVSVNTSTGVATIKDGTNTANVYTKEQADATFVQTDKNNTFTGNNIFNGDVTMSQGLSITGGTLSTTGNATVGGTLGVTGALNGTSGTFSGAIQAATLTTTGAATVDSLAVANGATVGGTFGVTGETTLSGNLKGTTATFTGLVNTAGLNAGSGNITTTGALSAGDATVTSLNAGSGNISTTGAISGGTLASSGNATIGGTLSAGATTVTSLTSAGDVTATGALKGATLQTTSNANVGGDLDVTGDISGDNAVLTGNLTAVDGTFSGDVSAASLTSAGDVTATGALKGATLETTGNATVGGDLDVAGDATVDGDLDVTGDISADNALFTGDVDITGDLSASNATVTTLKIGSSAAVDSVDDGSAALTSGNATTLASTATVLKSAENATYTGATVKGASPVPATLKDAISTTTASLNNILTTAGDEVDSNKVDVQWNSTDSTLATVLGNGAYTSINEIAAGDSVTTALSSLDTAIGDRTITSANSAINTALATDISTAVAKIGDEIGTQAYSNTASVNYNAIAANTDLTTAVSQVSSNIGAAANGSKGNISGSDSVNANLDSLDTAIGDRTSFSTTAAVDYTTAGLNNKDMVGAVSQVASNIGAPITSVQDRTKGKIDAGNTVNANIAALDAAIGADVTKTYNGVATSNAINENIDAINATIGNMDTDLHKTYVAGASIGNALTNGGQSTPATVVESLNNIDATLGTIHGLKTKIQTTNPDAGTNLASGTTVENHLTTLDASIGNRTALGSKNAAINTGTATSVAAGLKATGDAIGDMNFSSTRYASGSQDLSSAIRSLDSNIYRIDREVSDLKHDFKSGMASMAAMTALVPNARSCGDTSLSLGTGAYDGHTAMAIGGFHYLNDNLLLNAGVAWGNTDDLAYRMGVTFSW